MTWMNILLIDFHNMKQEQMMIFLLPINGKIDFIIQIMLVWVEMEDQQSWALVRFLGYTMTWKHKSITLSKKHTPLSCGLLKRNPTQSLGYFCLNSLVCLSIMKFVGLYWRWLCCSCVLQEKESLITELRKELRVSDEEHRELLSRVNADDVIHRIRSYYILSYSTEKFLYTIEQTVVCSAFQCGV